MLKFKHTGMSVGFVRVPVDKWRGRWRRRRRLAVARAHEFAHRTPTRYHPPCGTRKTTKVGILVALVSVGAVKMLVVRVTCEHPGPAS